MWWKILPAAYAAAVLGVAARDHGLRWEDVTGCHLLWWVADRLDRSLFGGTC